MLGIGTASATPAQPRFNINDCGYWNWSSALVATSPADAYTYLCAPTTIYDTQYPTPDIYVVIERTDRVWLHGFTVGEGGGSPYSQCFNGVGTHRIGGYAYTYPENVQQTNNPAPC
jgi:hypothetical protein